MSNSVETLEATFRSSEAKLNVVLCQLEDCFAKFDAEQQKYGNQSDRETPISLNPVKIISALTEIKTELQEVKQDYRELQDYKEKVDKDLAKETESISQLINITIDSLKT